MILSLLGVVAAAHPLGARFATQTTKLVVHADHVDVDYVAEVPLEFVRTARPGGADPVGAMATELASGLLLEVDGEVVSLEPRPAVAPAPTSEHTVGFTLALTAPLPPGAREIRVSTANLQEAENFYAGDVRLAPGLRAASCSLLHVRGGRVVRDDTLRWVRDEQARTLEVVLTAPEPGWWTRLFGRSEGVRAAKVLVDSPLDPVPEWAELLLVVALLLGHARLNCRGPVRGLPASGARHRPEVAPRGVEGRFGDRAPSTPLVRARPKDAEMK